MGIRRAVWQYVCVCTGEARYGTRGRDDNKHVAYAWPGPTIEFSRFRRSAALAKYTHYYSLRILALSPAVNHKPPKPVIVVIIITVCVCVCVFFFLLG